MLPLSQASSGLSSGCWPCPEHAVPSGANRCSLTDVLSQPLRWASAAHGCPPASRPMTPASRQWEQRQGSGSPRPGTQPAKQSSDPAPVHRHIAGPQPPLGGVLQKMLGGWLCYRVSEVARPSQDAEWRVAKSTEILGRQVRRGLQRGSTGHGHLSQRSLLTHLNQGFICFHHPAPPHPNAFPKHKPPHFSARPSRRTSTPAHGLGCG